MIPKKIKRRAIVGAGLLAVIAGVALPRLFRPKRLGDAEFAARYATSLQKPANGMSVYHLGHSLVGRDMRLC